MAEAKTIILLMIDGNPTGRIECKLDDGWIGIAYKIPRTLIKKSKVDENLEYVEGSGIYFLLGKDQNDHDSIYVGQAGARGNGKGLLGRIKEPHNQIDWAEAIMFTTVDNSLSSDDISHLERSFYDIASDLNRYKVKNGNRPNSGNPRKHRKIALDEFINRVKLIMSTLGHKVFEPYISSVEKSDESLLYMKHKNSEAIGQRTNEGFLIFKGSVIEPTTTPSCPKSVIKFRRDYADDIENYRLKTDILMSSPSAAACFVGGASLNGYTCWYDKSGTTLKDLEIKDLKAEDSEIKGVEIKNTGTGKKDISEVKSNGPLLYMKHKNSEATGQRTNEGFLIFKGSIIEPTTTPSCPKSAIKSRKNHKDDIKDGSLKIDILMSSPSAAACFVGGSSLNGYTCWHDEEGTTLKDLDAQ